MSKNIKSYFSYFSRTRKATIAWGWGQRQKLLLPQNGEINVVRVNDRFEQDWAQMIGANKAVEFGGGRTWAILWSYTHFTKINFHQKCLRCKFPKSPKLFTLPSNWLASLFTIWKWAKLLKCKTGPHVPILKCLIGYSQVLRNGHLSNLGNGNLVFSESEFQWNGTMTIIFTIPPWQDIIYNNGTWAKFWWKEWTQPMHFYSIEKRNLINSCNFSSSNSSSTWAQEKLFSSGQSHALFFFVFIS